MVIVRRLRLLVMCFAAIAAAVFAVHLATQPPMPGRLVTWTTAQGGAPAPSAPRMASGMPAAPSATPAVAGPLDGLRQPLNALLQRLNADTAHTASGQLSILQTLENALRDHIEHFLNWITGRS